MTMRLRSCALERWTSHKTDTWPILETHCVYIMFRDIWCFTKPNRSQTMFIIYVCPCLYGQSFSKYSSNRVAIGEIIHVYF